jgi:hypothetical protein
LLSRVHSGPGMEVAKGSLQLMSHLTKFGGVVLLDGAFHPFDHSDTIILEGVNEFMQELVIVLHKRHGSL